MFVVAVFKPCADTHEQIRHQLISMSCADANVILRNFINREIVFQIDKAAIALLWPLARCEAATQGLLRFPFLLSDLLDFVPVYGLQRAVVFLNDQRVEWCIGHNLAPHLMAVFQLHHLLFVMLGLCLSRHAAHHAHRQKQCHQFLRFAHIVRYYILLQSY